MGKGGGSPIAKSSLLAGKQVAGVALPAQKAMFRQLAQALATGGRGMRAPFVQQAEARSREAGMAALRGADTTLAGGLPGNIRGRVLNRIIRGNEATTSAIGPSFAQQLIRQAPMALTGQSQAQLGGYEAAGIGERAALQAAQTRAQGWASAANSVAGTLGSLQGTYGNWSANQPQAAPAANSAAGPYASGYRMPNSWLSRFG